MHSSRLFIICSFSYTFSANFSSFFINASIANSKLNFDLLDILIVSLRTCPAAITGVSNNLSSIYLGPTFSSSSPGINFSTILHSTGINGTIIIVLITLNIVCAFAICLFTSLEKYETNLPKNPGTIIGKNIIVPTTLNIKCNIAALWAVLLVPTVASIAVIQVPILHPIIIGSASLIFNAPAVANATSIPVVADELWRTAVIKAPAINPKYQCDPTVVSISWNIGDDVNGFIASLIVPIPTNKIPKPSIIFPISLLLFPLTNITIMAPTNTKIGAISSNLNATNCAVTVVPTFAPIIIPAAWAKFINPALTNPTTITVVALLLWITIVTTAPTITPIKGFFVTFSSIFFNPSPAAFSSPSPISFIP